RPHGGRSSARRRRCREPGNPSSSPLLRGRFIPPRGRAAFSAIRPKKSGRCVRACAAFERRPSDAVEWLGTETRRGRKPQKESHLKILVALKRVADPDNANKLKVTPQGDAVDTSGLEWKMNPFDEYALESALRLTENGKAPKARIGEVVVVTLAPKDAETTLRAALATGADRAIRVEATDDQLDGGLVAEVLKNLVVAEKPDLVLMGKQTVDGESN